jgi:hypothetical protein
MQPPEDVQAVLKLASLRWGAIDALRCCGLMSTPGLQTGPHNHLRHAGKGWGGWWRRHAAVPTTPRPAVSRA